MKEKAAKPRNNKYVASSSVTKKKACKLWSSRLNESKLPRQVTYLLVVSRRGLNKCLLDKERCLRGIGESVFEKCFICDGSHSWLIWHVEWCLYFPLNTSTLRSCVMTPAPIYFGLWLSTLFPSVKELKRDYHYKKPASQKLFLRLCSTNDSHSSQIIPNQQSSQAERDRKLLE